LNPTPDALQTELQAAEWLIRLEADASVANLARWRQWLGENARHRAVYLRLERGWRETNCLRKLRPVDGPVRLDLLDDFPGLASSGSHEARAIPRWKIPHRMLTAAMLAVILVGALTLAWKLAA
jgi:ferric-dicitrate binding protein FerR (iron transport regulator)